MAPAMIAPCEVFEVEEEEFAPASLALEEDADGDRETDEPMLVSDAIDRGVPTMTPFDMEYDTTCPLLFGSEEGDGNWDVKLELELELGATVTAPANVEASILVGTCAF